MNLMEITGRKHINMNLVETNKGEVVITLKEITDLIDVRHNDSMKKVKKLAKEPSFGELRETRISHIKGKEMVTYSLNKKQAIAVGAKLNNKLLMKVIDRLEELEKAKPKAPALPTTYLEALQDLVAKETLLLEQAPVVEAYNDLTHQDKDTMNFMSLGEVAKELGYAPRAEFNPMLRKTGVIFMGSTEPKSVYVEKGWFVGTPIKKGSYAGMSWKVTPKGMAGMLKKFGRKGDK